MIKVKRGDISRGDYRVRDIMELVDDGVIVTTYIIARATGMERTKTRRLLDKMVNKGWLNCEQKRFWNGMHYATRNYYWRGK